MIRTRQGIAVALVGAMLGPSVAWAAEYPRQISIEGMDCIEKIGAAGELETWCQTGDQMRLMSVDPDGPSDYEAYRPPAAPLPAPGERWSEPDTKRARGNRYALANYQLRSPYAAAQSAAQAHAYAGKYFGGGFAGGFFLGPLGWIIAGLTASNSDVYIPTALPPEWTPAEQNQFMFTYTSEVRSKRTTNAILGGLCGTVVAGIVIYSIASAASD